MYSPFVCFKAKFLASAGPLFSWENILIKLYLFEKSSKIFKELSVDPSLIHIISISFNDWLIILFIDFSKYFSAL